MMKLDDAILAAMTGLLANPDTRLIGHGGVSVDTVSKTAVAQAQSIMALVEDDDSELTATRDGDGTVKLWNCVVIYSTHNGKYTAKDSINKDRFIIVPSKHYRWLSPGGKGFIGVG